MTSYVIRGGEEGKARLSVISEALASSTAGLLDAAGLRGGMRCLDLGCGGGDVTLAIARVVGPGGSVVGIDMDAVKIDLARQDASDQGVEHVEFRSGDATTLDADSEYDLVYARFLLTHLVDPEAALRRMIAAVEPGGVVVVEDLDHSAVFAYPNCPALDRFVTLYNATAQGRGGDPEIGPKLMGMLRRAGLDGIQLRGDATGVHGRPGEANPPDHAGQCEGRHPAGRARHGRGTGIPGGRARRVCRRHRHDHGVPAASSRCAAGALSDLWSHSRNRVATTLLDRAIWRGQSCHARQTA